MLKRRITVELPEQYWETLERLRAIRRDWQLPDTQTATVLDALDKSLDVWENIPVTQTQTP